jgi:prepilin-type N-terminal cleavage/methylation domain-containing protein
MAQQRPYTPERRRGSSPRAGFTLVEIIAVMALVGVLAAYTSIGIVQGVDVYFASRDATELGAKGSLAINRLVRTLRNVTDISVAGPDAVTVSLLQDGSSQTHSISQSADRLLVNGLPLADRLAANNGFNLSYFLGTGETWSLASNSLDQLAYVEIRLSFESLSGIPIVFQSRVVPRNTYIPQGFSPGGVGATAMPSNCFVATAAHGSGQIHIVQVLRSWRDKVLAETMAGRALIKLYYRYGPGAAEFLDHHDFLKPYVRTMLMPLSAWASLRLSSPASTWGIFAMCLSVALLAVRAMRYDRSAPLPVQHSLTDGFALMGVLSAMLVIGVLSTAMVPLFSSSVQAGAGSDLSARAYYLAESGMRYAGKKYMEAPAASKDSVIIDLHQKSSFSLSAVESFDIDVEPWWFEADVSAANPASLRVQSVGDFPEQYRDGSVGSGRLVVGTSLTTYNGLIHDEDAGELQFDNVGIATALGVTDVFPAASIPSDVSLMPGDNLVVDGDDIRGLPAVRGVLTLISGTKEYYLIYERANYASAVLENLQNVPGKTGLPSSGASIKAGDFVVLGKYAGISSTGTVGVGASQASRTIQYHQPLEELKLYTRKSFSDDFNESPKEKALNWTSIQGDFDVGTHDGDGALFLDASHTTNFTAPFFSALKDDNNVEEALAKLDVDASVISDAGLNFDTIWKNSDKTLSYELQVKMKFSASQDSDATNPYGTWMPGLAFRLEEVEGSVSASAEGDGYGHAEANFYGLSFMRGITGGEYKNSGFLRKTYDDEDDIPDTLFDNHGINSQGCDDASGDCAWDDDAPMDGMPYLLLWQRYKDNDEGVKRWEWLAYQPLVRYEPVTIYQYKSGNGKPEQWFKGSKSSDSRSPLLYAAYELTDVHGLFQTSSVSGVEILGMGNEMTVLDPDTSKPVPGKAYIFPAEDYDFEKAYDYRLYLKDWSTLHAKVIEMVGDFDGDGDEDRVNLIQARFADTQGSTGTYGDPKDDVRKAVPRGSIVWPDDQDCMTFARFERHDAPYDYIGYTSKVVDVDPSFFSTEYVKLVDRGQDETGDYVNLFSGMFTTDPSESHFNNSEVGIHSLGIDGQHETVYFDDFSMVLYEGTSVGLMPGFQEER